MLVLSRRPGEEIIISDNIKITVVSIKGDRIRIGITAPNSVQVDRAEVHERRMTFVDLTPTLSSSHFDTGVLDSHTMVISREEEMAIR